MPLVMLEVSGGALWLTVNRHFKTSGKSESRINRLINSTVVLLENGVPLTEWKSKY